MEKDYTNLSKYYDYLQRDMNYQVWVDWVVKQNFKKDISILEIGCGTGTVANELTKLGYTVDAFDYSDEMIRQAKLKNSNINFYQDDITTFKVDKKYDLILCFMDTLNYIVEEKDIKSSFKNVYNALNDGGIFLFDIHQLDNFDNFDGYLETGYIEDIEYVWHSYGQDYDKNIIHHDFRFVDKDNELKERHVQRILALKEYKKIYDKLFKDESMHMDDYRIYIKLVK